MGETGQKGSLRSLLLKAWLARQSSEMTWALGKKAEPEPNTKPTKSGSVCFQLH